MWHNQMIEIDEEHVEDEAFFRNEKGHNNGCEMETFLP